MDLEAWKATKAGLWNLENGVLAAQPNAGNLWTREAFGDFLLECEFRLDVGGNSGVFVRTADISDPVQTGLEVQLADLPPTTDGTSMACGALWGYLAPAKRAVRPAGEWNALAITCAGSHIEVVLNGEQVVKADTDQWTTPGQAPDGTPTRFQKALREHPRSGYIALQGMGTPVWYRRLRLRRLDGASEPAGLLGPPTSPLKAEGAAPALGPLARPLLSGRAAEALQRWREETDELGRGLTEAQRQAVGAQLEALAGFERLMLASFRADVGKTLDVELAKEKITAEVREAAADGIRVNQVVRQGQSTGRLGRTVRLAELSVAERLRRLGSGDTPELNVQRGLLALEAARPETARKLFEKAGGPLAEALLGELRTRQAEAKEVAAEQALIELLRQVSTSPKLGDKDKVMAAIRKRCGDDLKRVQAARKALTEFEKDWGETDAGKEWAAVVRRGLTYPIAGDVPLRAPGIGLELVPLAAGEFVMGSAGSPHKVRISRPLWIGRYEVTQAEFEAVMGWNHSRFGGPRRPVEMASWRDAETFCSKLSTTERAAGRLPDGFEFRLPTEAEWEYACRAGTTGEFAGSPDELGWYDSNSGGQTHDVGLKKPNAWGLFDMHGNVFEWCLDGYDESYYARSPVADPLCPGAGLRFRVTRGGCWEYPVNSAAAGSRSGGWGELAVHQDVGFRVVLAARIPAAAP